MKKLDSGRIETIIAFIVLAAVVALCVRFYRPQASSPVPSSALEAPAAN